MTARGRAFLLVVRGPRAGSRPGSVFAVDKARQVIGRSRSADITLSGGGVADHHVCIWQTSAGFELEALDDATTLVGGRSVLRAFLQNRDRIQIGELELAFLVDDGLPTRNLAN